MSTMTPNQLEALRALHHAATNYFYGPDSGPESVALAADMFAAEQAARDAGAPGEMCMRIRSKTHLRAIGVTLAEA